MVMLAANVPSQALTQELSAFGRSRTWRLDIVMLSFTSPSRGLICYAMFSAHDPSKANSIIHNVELFLQ